MKPAEYSAAAREIEANHAALALRDLRVGFVSTFTAEVLKQYLVVEGARKGFFIQPYFAPFGFLEQELMSPESGLYQQSCSVVVIAARLEELAPALTDDFMSFSSEALASELDRIERRILGLLQALRKQSGATALVFNFAPVLYPSAGLADPGLERSQAMFIGLANERIARACRGISGAFVFDYHRAVTEAGLRRWQDPKLFYLGRVPVGVEAQIELGKSLARSLRATQVAPAKVLVLDLDGTLWGGVLGDDGANGIILGGEYPGNVFKDFQRSIKSLRGRGILLAIASKNNLADVKEVFESNPDCVLKLEDFSAVQAHWNDKASSLKAIAGELNVGVDSLVFFDDNPVERDWVRSQLPEVNVIDVPQSPMEYVQTLAESCAFDQLSLSEEDRRRAELYRNEKERQSVEVTASSVEDFLKQLKMVATLGGVGRETLPRVSQLLAKTNQFNLTTRRHSALDLEGMLRGGALGLWLRISDRFGDNGLVGVAIARPSDPGAWVIDSFLLSCRVIGRQAENVLLGALARKVREKGGRTLVGEYIPTPKNKPSADFLPQAGFERLDPGGRLWSWDLDKSLPPIPELIETRFEDA